MRCIYHAHDTDYFNHYTKHTNMLNLTQNIAFNIILNALA